MSKLLKAVTSSNFKEVQTLIKEGEDVNYVNTLGNSLIYIAIQNKDIKILEELLNTPKIDVNIKNKSFGYTPLISAVSQPNTLITKMLLNKNADVDIQSNNGNTALMISLGLTGKNDLPMLLINHNANIDVSDSIGYNALCFSIENENEVIFDKLLERNVDITLKTNNTCAVNSICLVKNKSMAIKLCLKANENNQLNIISEHWNSVKVIRDQLKLLKATDKITKDEFCDDFIKIVNSIRLKNKLDSLDNKKPIKSRKI